MPIMRARIPLPAERHSGLDGDACLDRRRQDRVLVVVVLLVEELPARHRDDADVRLERPRRLESEVHLAAGRDHDRLGLAVATLPERVCAAQGTLGRRDDGAVERRQLLPREREGNGPVRALERDPPGHRRLVRVGRSHVPEVRDRPQRHVVLDRLVRRPVLADGDRVVRPDPGRAEPHQRREAHGGHACSRRRSGTSSRRAGASPGRARSR